ncbi:MAG: hypothetical protein GWN71_05730, partial [Gammaproteobacteria bacterium]|nr:hypothetical protein [Gammaproteobacteria bacterium]
MMLRFPPYLLVCAMLTGCGDASGGARAVVRDSAGITIVENQNAPADTVRLDSPVVRIGQRGLDAAEEYTFV